MKTHLPTVLIRTALLIAFTLTTFFVNAQNSSKSLLVNHGAAACGSSSGEQHFFAGAITANPSLVKTCNVGLPYYSVFTAYNPADQKIYCTTISGTGTQVYVLDFNISGEISCPTVSTPNYVYNYVLNQLCFDNNGNNYGFYNFDAINGTAQIAQFDIATGVEKNGTQRTVQFPAGNVPNTVGDGDIVILPNGRMFATFGNAPSKLYELSNPTATGAVTAAFLTDLPRTCFSIGFVDGNLVVAGSDGAGCYYYIWDINSFTLSNAVPFPLGKNSADMSNLTVAIGSSKQLRGARVTSDNTATLYYEIVVKNKGNVTLSNVQVKDDLAKAFGATNVSNVKLNFLNNAAGLQLNPFYNGVSDINLLLAGQSLKNFPISADSSVLSLEVTVTNMVEGVTYYNSAIANGQIGSGSSFLAVTDSTNNGSSARIDLDGNGVSDDEGENIPTPYVFSSITLPVEGFLLQGVRNNNAVQLTWQVASGHEHSSYEVERSSNGHLFEKIGSVGSGNTSFIDGSSGTKGDGLFYRVKAYNVGKPVQFSNTVYVRSASTSTLSVYPNPVQEALQVQYTASVKGPVRLLLRDINGRILKSQVQNMLRGTNYFSLNWLSHLQAGFYYLTIEGASDQHSVKLRKL